MIVARSSPVVRLCQWHSVALVLLLLIFSTSGNVSIISLLLGAGLAILPGIVFTLYMFRHVGARQAKNAMRSMFVGELLKLLFTIVGFALVFSLFPELYHLSFWIGFVVCLLIPIVAAGAGHILPKAPTTAL